VLHDHQAHPHVRLSVKAESYHRSQFERPPSENEKGPELGR
jgi:hypothetical protein